MARTITSANAVFLLGIAGLFPIPQKLEGFGVDDAFETEAVDAGIVQLGVDGIGVGGLVPFDVPMRVAQLAASNTFQIFDQWIAAQQAAGDVLYANAIITLRSIGRQYTLYQGLLTRYPTMPAAKRVLMQRDFTIVWMPPASGVPAISVASI